MIIKRGDIVLVDLEPVKGSEQGKARPCLVIQNDIGNQFGPTTIVAAITSQTLHTYPFTVFLKTGEANLPKDSLVLCNQLRTISKEHRIIKKWGSVRPEKMRQVDEALKVSLALD
ncbi:type II toxin-antitoxin system PemK/MazF family toxin [Candidatus Micrarchaeota archaeon]|nr:type II toxin-antitoxin system PemK/MazF family toxin [Candidatus Micrarchaeota archaeon]